MPLVIPTKVTSLSSKTTSISTPSLGLSVRAHWHRRGARHDPFVVISMALIQRRRLKDPQAMQCVPVVQEKMASGAPPPPPSGRIRNHSSRVMDGFNSAYSVLFDTACTKPFDFRSATQSIEDQTAVYVYYGGPVESMRGDVSLVDLVNVILAAFGQKN